MVYSFIQNAINLNLINPWGSHILSNGDLLVFPYGIVMYFAYLPVPILGFVFKDLIPSHLIVGFGLGLQLYYLIIVVYLLLP